MSSASLRSPGSRRALIAGVVVVIAAAGVFYMSRPAANVAPAASTAGPQDIVARGRVETGNTAARCCPKAGAS